MDESLLDRILRPQVLPFLVPIAAIIVGGVIAVTKLIIRHRERVAMIERGIDPDDPHACAIEEAEPPDSRNP